jgi:hypothetical protein
MTPRQQKKLQLHERCAHVHWDQLNSWIRTGCLPCDPDLANEPNPVCATCQFGKAHKRSHKCDTGHIGKSHTAPGDGVIHQDNPSNKRYKYCSFWVDHFSQFVYVTMHKTKRAEELVHSKLEFQDFASCYNVQIKNIRADNGVYTTRLFQDKNHVCNTAELNFLRCRGALAKRHSRALYRVNCEDIRPIRIGRQRQTDTAQP